jgi:hypothetical protein
MHYGSASACSFAQVLPSFRFDGCRSTVTSTGAALVSSVPGVGTESYGQCTHLTTHLTTHLLWADEV